MNIEEIHQSDIYGIFIEVGAGVPVVSSLFSVSGASNTVYFSESPYSQDSYIRKYLSAEKENFRSVSPQYLQKIIEYPEYLSLFTQGKINTIFTSTFQLGEYNNRSTHGWIALKYKDSVCYYHISLPEPLSRKEYIERIGENGLKILQAKNSEIPEDCDVDIVLDQNLKPDFAKTISFIANLRSKEVFSVFSPDKIERLETITRNTEEMIIFKGSFNPVQNAHLNIIQEAEKHYPQAKAYFMISLNVVQKGKQTSESILSRIELLFALGYQVIVCNNPYFRINVNFLRNKFSPEKTVILAMGIDTLNRLLEDYQDEKGNFSHQKMKKDFPNTKFFCMNRENISLPDFLKNISDNDLSFFSSAYEELSSTKIRAFLAEKNFAAVKKTVPEKVYQLIIENKWN